MLIFAFHTSCFLTSAVVAAACTLLESLGRLLGALSRPEGNHIAAVASRLIDLLIVQVDRVRGSNQLLALRGLDLAIVEI